MMEYSINIPFKTRELTKIIWTFLTVLLSLPACGQEKTSSAITTDTPAHPRQESMRGIFSRQNKLVLDSALLQPFFSSYPALRSYAKDVQEFYKRRNYAYAWFENSKLIEQASNLANRILNLKYEGLHQQAPYARVLDSLLFTDVGSTRRVNTDLELMLTAQYFVFARLAWTGQSASTSRAVNWYLPRKRINYQQYLDTLIAARAVDVKTAGPVYRQYELLRTFLVKYHQLAATNWAEISINRELVTGDSSAAIAAVKARLRQLDDFSGDTTGVVFDQELASAIRRFQERHGLSAQGTLNAETLKELNVPPQRRIEQLIVNMERSRWLPVQLSSDYLAVNIPEFKLHVYHADSLLWSCKAVVGQTMHQTTVFYGELQYIVFSPYWNIPPGILRKEVLPAIRRDPGYLKAHHMEVTGQKNGLPAIRQRPGPDNPLGLVKFVFPNSYNIYLHDTPSKSLFDQTTRAFSHGCIRISEPERLAASLLKGWHDWPLDKIRRFMNAGKENTVKLRDPVPVFIAYFTAFVDRMGKLNFRRDIYDLDTRLLNTLLQSEHE
ncbi:L,D-transpeptidase family protein [Mucilaginibacter aquariorum]|uniref:L,D-transpeptidase family protein n=1 Tax=Mucilaginibacter aquariorum TaxID=2967225 RepID=A0ABT1T2M0_9SPHI|nr:L,D-transpeptidase family protein [Mucilaginibacter aquariorum]MCQ6958723.1 L,D-transpeptidase family protein [Mucilaginibacter aquariorum]